MRKAVFDEKRGDLGRICRLLAEDKEQLQAADRKRVEQALTTLRERFGYTDASARDSAARLLTARFADWG